MPNGKPGDHPFSDIVVHGSSAEFGEEISDLVRTMYSRPGFEEIREQVTELLWTSSHTADGRITLLANLKGLLSNLDGD